LTELIDLFFFKFFQIKKPTTKEEPVAEEKSAPKAPRLITSRIVFLKVGQIDTRNERYDAEGIISFFILYL